MPLERERFWNPERALFATLAGGVALAAANYLFVVPPPIEDELLPARSAMVERDVRFPPNEREAMSSLLQAPVEREDPFSLPEDEQRKSHAFKKPDPPQNDNQQANANQGKQPPPQPPQPPPQRQVGRPQVRLPETPKPIAKTPDTPGDAVAAEPERPPFPLDVVGIVLLDPSDGLRRVLVKDQRTGTMLELREQDEHPDSLGGLLKVLEIGPTYALFERSDHTQHRITKDPLEALRPLLRDEVEEPDGEEMPEGDLPIGDLGTLDLGQGGQDLPEILRNLNLRGGKVEEKAEPNRRHEVRQNKKQIREQDLAPLMEMLQKNKGLLEQLGETY